MTLHRTFEAQLVKSQNCPSKEFFLLQFGIQVTGDESESIRQDIFVPIYYSPPKASSVDQIQYKKMIIETLDLSQTGMLKIIFSKEIHPTRLNFQDSSKAQNRTLASQVDDYNIADVVTLIVEDVLLDEVEGDEKQISNYFLTKVSNDTLEIQVDFLDFKTISADINFKDRLMVNITHPELFIDAETGISLETGQAKHFIAIEQ